MKKIRSNILNLSNIFSGTPPIITWRNLFSENYYKTVLEVEKYIYERRGYSYYNFELLNKLIAAREQKLMLQYTKFSQNDEFYD